MGWYPKPRGLPITTTDVRPYQAHQSILVLVKEGKRLPEKLDFSPCRERCSHPRGQATAYHRRCAEGVIPLASSDLPKDQEFAAALHHLTSQVLAYAYDPPPEEVARRNRWHANTLLASMVGGALPPEICQQIADAGTRDQAARTALSQLPHLREPEYVAAYPAKDVYARHVSFEGLRYVSSLSNEKKGADYVRIWSSSPTMLDKIVVLVAEDHLGIREVRILGSAGFPVVEEHPNIWWRAFRVKRENMLHGKTDVSVHVTLRSQEMAQRRLSPCRVHRASSYGLCERLTAPQAAIGCFQYRV